MSKDDFLSFLSADQKALGMEELSVRSITNEIYAFQKLLRRVEYLQNTRKKGFQLLVMKILFRRKSIKLGYSISPNTFGPGLSIAHRGTVVVNGGARIGANCRIHVDVNIGTEAGKSDSAPKIGDNCYIGPGAKIFGPIEIGSGTVIGANAVVNKSFPEGNQTIGGIPAKVISDKSSEGLLIKGYNLD